jgi:hypothetical protein
MPHLPPSPVNTPFTKMGQKELMTTIVLATVILLLVKKLKLKIKIQVWPGVAHPACGYRRHKVLPWPAMLDPSMPCGRATAVFSVTCQQGGRPTVVFYPLRYPTPYGSGTAWGIR